MNCYVSLDLRRITDATASLKRKDGYKTTEIQTPVKKQRLQDSSAAKLPVAAFDQAIFPALFWLLQRACTGDLERWYNPSEPPVRSFTKEQLIKRRQCTSVCCTLPVHLMESAAAEVWVSTLAYPANERRYQLQLWFWAVFALEGSVL